MEQGLSLPDLLGVLRRRWPLAVAPTLIGSLLAVAIAMILPPSYISTARILVESQQIPEDLARSTVSAGPTERIRLIEQRLTTRQNLLDIARRFDIYADRPDITPTEIVELMREATRIEDVVLATQSRGEVTATAVNISFRAARPDLAARVTNEFVTQVLEQNIQQRNARASETLNFFNAEVGRLGEAIGALEAQIADFKRENENALPGSLEFRQSQYVALQEQAFEREGRKIAIEERIRALRDQLETGSGAMALSPEQEELNRLRQALAQQRGIYNETHPAMRALTQRIAALESSITVVSDADPAQIAAPPEVIAAVNEVAALERQLALIENQMAADAVRLEELRNSIDRTPEIEITLGGLERGLANLQVQYEQALLKQADAARGERLEVNRQAERFEVIDQAQVPTEPDSPNRLLIMAAGFTGSFGLGVGLMVLVEFLNRALWSARDIERQLGLRPIVVIPRIATRREITRRRWMRRAAAVAVLVIVPLGLYAVDQFYRPLPLLAERLAEILGLDSLIAIIENRLR
jgi:polysaccharide chain length determinant protein (PEP-CTERM system associated)